MADGFREREKGAEAKWAHDEELRFKVMARRDRLLGLWAAAELGLSGAAAEDYAKAVIQSAFHKSGDADMLRKLRDDFAAKKARRADSAIRRKMDELLALAGRQILSESGR
jgi:hypothetical protein